VLETTRQIDEALATAFELDFRRLLTVMPEVGRSSLRLRLGWESQRAKLRRENRSLGEFLASCDGYERSTVSRALIKASGGLPDALRDSSAATDGPMVEAMRERGSVSFGTLLEPDQISEIRRHLDTKSVLLGHDAHVAKQAASLAAVPPDANYTCYDYLDLWSAPHILEIASRPDVLRLAEGYLGCVPTLYSINSFWSFPNRQPHKASQVFHRDWEDYRSLILFVLLTPVDEPEQGAHYYVEGSHEFERLEAKLDALKVDPEDRRCLLGRDERTIAPAALRLFGQAARCYYGPAGTSFCADGFGFHRAVVPASKPRQLLWFRFGNFYNETMYSMPLRQARPETARQVLARIPDTERHRYIFRYLIEQLAAV